MTRPKVILDSKGLLYHMYYRGTDPSPIHTKSGKTINSAGWGFSNWLDEYIIPILNDFHASEVIAVYDGGSEYRTSMFPAYKEARKKAKLQQPPEETHQLKLLEEASKVFLANIGVICVSADGVEADDTIAAICKGYHDVDKVIHTGDADMLQLADDRTVVYIKNAPVGMVYKGVNLRFIRLHKTIVGDKSDGYNGVPRLGQAAWETLVVQYGLDGLEEIENCIRTKNYDAIRESLQDKPEKVLNHLYENRKEAEKFYDLASLHPELCHQFRGNKLIWPKYYLRVPNREKVLHVLNQMGCPRYAEKFEYLMPRQELVTEDNVELAMEHFIDNLPLSPCISFDYETVDLLKHPDFAEALPKQSRAKGYLDVLSSEITGCALNYGPDLQYTIYLSTNHTNTANISPTYIDTCLRQVEKAGIPLVAHNAGFEENICCTNLGYIPEKIYDTMIMGSYVNENEEAGLKAMSLSKLAYTQTSYRDLLQSAGVSDMSELTGEQVLSYGCDDALVTAHLFRLCELILRMEGQWEFYRDTERAPMHVLNHGFRIGVRLDYAEVERLHLYATKTITEGMAKIRELLTENCKEVNPKAAKQLDEADGANLSALLRANSKKNLSDDALLAKRQERLLLWEEATVYREYSEVYLPPEFLGTPTQLNIVAESLGVDLATVRIQTVNNKQLNIYLTMLRQHGYLESRQMILFSKLLAEAASFLHPKHRCGPEWDNLKAFCLPYLGGGSVEKVGDELNLNSPAQMKELLYCKLALPVRSRTKVNWDSGRAELGLKGSPSTDDDAMQKAIAEDCQDESCAWKKEVLQTVSTVKTEMTKISLYYRCYPLWKHPSDAVTHPQIRNCGTVTRRPTGSNYNILQVEKGPTRAVFLPRYNEDVIVAADFSGQELRITGSESKDKVLIEAYTGGGTFADEDGMIHPVTKDIHTVTAISFADTIFRREMGAGHWDITYDNFRKWMFGDDKKMSSAANLARKMAKVVNFLIIYGGQASTLSMRLGVPEAFAEELMRLVFAAYQRLAPWQEETITFARQHGYVRTAYGTVKHLTEDIRSRDGSIRSRQERQAVNQTVQGCAADILKKVLTDTHEKNLWRETKSSLIAPVYDELVCSVPVRNVWEFVQRLQDSMNITPPGHAIPMMAEISIGPNWYAAGNNELGDRPSERKVMACIESFKQQLAA